MTRRFIGESGRVTALECDRASEKFSLKADLVLLAMGFTAEPLDVASAKGYATTDPRIFSCGDMRRGQSLVVWAIREGRECAQAVDHSLTER